MKFSSNILKIDPLKEVEKIVNFLTEQVNHVYKRDGIIVGLSGGVDSAVMAELAVRAVGSKKVFSLILPERESNPVSRQYAIKQARATGIEYKEVDISSTVDSICSYKWRDKYIKKLVPEYMPGFKYNIVLPTDLLDRDAYNFYTLQVMMPDGTIKKKRLNFENFRTVTAFASIKIRARMIHLYWEAERRGLVVAGTTNCTEAILGDFCKYGDGGTDIEALSYLYKTQIYQLANFLSIIPEIINRTPSPDTFSLPVSDQEFYFRIQFDKLDLLLYAWENKITSAKTAKVLNLEEKAVNRAFRDFTTKNRATEHLRNLPYTLG